MCAERERVCAEAREAERLRLLALSTVMESRALISTTVRQIASRPAADREQTCRLVSGTHCITR